MTNGTDPIAGASLQKNIGTSASLGTLANRAYHIDGASQNDNVQTSKHSLAGTFVDRIGITCADSTEMAYYNPGNNK